MKLKYLWIAFAVFLLITIPFRVYQVVALIDPKTNFYVKGTEFTLGLLIGLLALYTIGVLVLTAWRKDTVRHMVHKNVPAGIFAAVAGLLMLTESASELVSAVTNEGQRVEASVPVSYTHLSMRHLRENLLFPAGIPVQYEYCPQ